MRAGKKGARGSGPAVRDFGDFGRHEGEREKGGGRGPGTAA